MKKQLILIAFAAMVGTCLADTVIDFNGQSTTGNNNAFTSSMDGNHDWIDTGVIFSHEVTYGGYSWDGMTYSSVNDTTTAGFGTTRTISLSCFPSRSRALFVAFGSAFSNSLLMCTVQPLTVRVSRSIPVPPVDAVPDLRAEMVTTMIEMGLRMDQCFPAKFLRRS